MPNLWCRVDILPAIVDPAAAADDDDDDVMTNSLLTTGTSCIRIHYVER